MNTRESKVIVAMGCLTAVCISASACGGSPPALFASSPGQVAKEVYVAADAGKYSEVEKRLSAAALEAYKGPLGALVGGTKGIWDDETRNGTIAQVEVLKEDVRGEGANVSLKLTFRDGTVRQVERPLVKEGGNWKLSTWIDESAHDAREVVGAPTKRLPPTASALS